MNRVRSSSTRIVKRAGFQPTRVRNSGVDVDEVAADQLDLVGAAVASESKPTLTMPRKRLPLASPTSIRRLWPARSDLDRLLGLVGDAEHAGEVVAAPAGDDPQRRLRRRPSRRRPRRAARRRSSPPAARRLRSPAAPARRRARGPWCAGPGTRRGARRAPARPRGSSFSVLPPAEAGLTSSVSGIPSISMRSQPSRRRAPRSPPRRRPTEKLPSPAGGALDQLESAAGQAPAQEPSADARQSLGAARSGRGSGGRRGAGPGRSRPPRGGRRPRRRGRRSRPG